MKTIVGKLREALIIDTEENGMPITKVIPRGAIVEISSSNDYPHTITDKDIIDLVKYIPSYNKAENKLPLFDKADDGIFDRVEELQIEMHSYIREIKKTFPKQRWRKIKYDDYVTIFLLSKIAMLERKFYGK